MKQSLKLVTTLLIMLVTSMSSAVFAGTQTGVVLNIYLRSGDIGTSSDSLVYFVLSGAPSGAPACATSQLWMIRDAKSPIGQAQIAYLMTAKATGQVVSVGGTGLCVRWPDAEDVLSIN